MKELFDSLHNTCILLDKNGDKLQIAYFLLSLLQEAKMHLKQIFGEESFLFQFNFWLFGCLHKYFPVFISCSLLCELAESLLEVLFFLFHSFLFLH